MQAINFYSFLQTIMVYLKQNVLMYPELEIKKSWYNDISSEVQKWIEVWTKKAIYALWLIWVKHSNRSQTSSSLRASRKPFPFLQLLFIDIEILRQPILFS